MHEAGVFLCPRIGAAGFQNWHPNWHRTRDYGPVRSGIADRHHPRNPAENREIRDTPLFGGTDLFGFEARAPHRGAILFPNEINILQVGRACLDTFVPDSAFSGISIAAAAHRPGPDTSLR
jgi:hypothetical protein